jgi:hypothetical protein
MVRYRALAALCVVTLLACNSAVTQDGGQEIEAGVSIDIGHLVLAPTVVDFGDRCEGVIADASVTLRNAGVAELTWGDDASSDFEVVDSGEVMGWLAPGAACTMTLRYTPTRRRRTGPGARVGC